MDQAHRLWAHWDRPNVLWYEGGHLTFLWSGQVTRFLDDAMASAGFIEPRTPPRMPETIV